jgi:hypothetical protein
MSSSLEKSKNKKPMEADPTSGEEQVQAKKRNPGREEAPAPLPVPAGRPAFYTSRKFLRSSSLYLPRIFTLESFSTSANLEPRHRSLPLSFFLGFHHL